MSATLNVIPPGPMTPREAFSWARAALGSAGVEDAALDARLFVLHAWGVQAHSIHLLPDVPGGAEQMEQLYRFVVRRFACEPTAYIVGRKEFWSLEFLVSPSVLIPRPDSETIVRHALDLLPDRDGSYRVLDLGTGSGCLLLAFLAERPGAIGIGIDASAAALTVARANAERLNLSGRAHFAQGDWAAGMAGRFDLVLCNPPYIADAELATLAPDVRNYEPGAALFAGPDGFAAYRRIIPELPAVLGIGGLAIFEAGHGQAATITSLCEAQGLELVGIRDDLGGVARSIAVRR